MPEHKKCPACGFDGEHVLNPSYGFQICCKNTRCLLRGPSRPVIVEAWEAWDNPGWRASTWGEELHDLRVNLDLANGELAWATEDLEKLEDELELARLQRDEWRDRYEELVERLPGSPSS